MPQRDEWTAIINAAADELVKSVNGLPEATTPPYGKVKLTREEQQAMYHENKDNPAYWQKVVAAHGTEGAYKLWKQFARKEPIDYGTQTQDSA
jgi:hypothetical protein